MNFVFISTVSYKKITNNSKLKDLSLDVVNIVNLWLIGYEGNTFLNSLVVKCSLMKNFEW